jgi:hypothetical protein
MEIFLMPLRGRNSYDKSKVRSVSWAVKQLITQQRKVVFSSRARIGYLCRVIFKVLSDAEGTS